MPRHDLLVPSLIGGFHFVSLNWSRPIFALLAGQLGANEMMLGALTSVFYLLPLIIALPAGMLTDRWGARRLAAAGSASLVLGNVLYAVATNFLALAAARVLCGLAQIVVLVAVQARVANLGKAGEQDRNFGTLFFFAGVGQLAGPLLAGFTSTAYGIRLSFAVGAVLALIPLAMSAWLPDAPGLARKVVAMSADSARGAGAAARSTTPRMSVATVGRLLWIPGVRLGVGASLILLLADGARESLFPWFAARSIGFDEATIGVLLSISALFSIAVQPFAGALAKALGRTRVLSLAMFCGAAGMIAVPFARTFWPMAGAMALAGLCMGANQPPSMACVADSAPPELRGMAMSLRLAGNRVGLLLSPIWGGWLVAARGLSSYFFAAAVILGAGSAFVGTLAGGGLRAGPRARTRPQAQT
ncbi:MAG: MFS transporter [Bacillota bacterium]|nr:MFS transporter [Bacillota bacterium]